MATPSEVYDYDVRTRARVLRKRQEVPSGHEPSAYVTRRIFATAPDGEQVPISLLHRRGLVLDGTAPCLLYGYGSYGSSMPANFRTNPLSLVDRGFVYAIAHVRGGTEKGWGWYTQGKRENKPNTFKDFVACAEALDGGGLHGARAHRRPWRQRRRHAHGRRREHGSRPLRRHRRRRALRRRPQHHARRRPAADPAGMAGMGQSGRVRGGFPHHPVLFPLRQREAAALSADPRARRPHRSRASPIGSRRSGSRACAPP